MVAVSQDYAPPFKLIAPYFIIGVIFFLISSIVTLFIDVNTLIYMDSTVLSWVHLLLLGFMMMIIFGAMAQLIPVTLEVGHFSVEFYYIIWPLLLIGTILMTLGFSLYTSLLPYGGTVVLISMFIFLLETFLTIKKVEKFNNVIKSLFVSNIFLLFGVIIGIILALGFSGVISIDIVNLLKAHVYLVVAGYICITIMALSLVLLPMFGLSHNFSQKPLNMAVIIMSIGVSFVFIASLIKIDFIASMGYVLSMISLGFYLYQIYLIYKTRARKENDIYVQNLFVSFGALFISIICAILYFATGYQSFLLCSGWLFFIGFFSFLIIGHLYKIVPFLVWFEYFSPLVGKQKVPMLVDMVPVRASKFQFWFTFIGTILISFGFLFTSNNLFKAGASFLVIGAIFLLKNLIFMIRYK